MVFSLASNLGFRAQSSVNQKIEAKLFFLPQFRWPQGNFWALFFQLRQEAKAAQERCRFLHTTLQLDFEKAYYKVRERSEHLLRSKTHF